MSENLENVAFPIKSAHWLGVGEAIQIFASLGMLGLIGVWIVEALGVPHTTWISIGLMTPSVAFFFGVSLFFAFQSRRSKRNVQRDA